MIYRDYVAWQPCAKERLYAAWVPLYRVAPKVVSERSHASIVSSRRPQDVAAQPGDADLRLQAATFPRRHARPSAANCAVGPPMRGAPSRAKVRLATRGAG